MLPARRGRTDERRRLRLKRPVQRPLERPRTQAERQALSARACYVGSAEHKASRWWGGMPGVQYKDGRPARPKRQTTTICPLVTERERDRATEWVRRAIETGQCKFMEGDKDFPKHIWYEADGQGWFGFCINSAAGQYKGWPLEEDERRAVFG